MQIKLSLRAASGQVLFVVIFIAAVMAMIITACLQLTTHQNQMGWRSQYWNECIPVAEAGVEESLMNLNQNGLTNLTAANWTSTNGGAFVDRVISSSNAAVYHAYLSGVGDLATNTVTASITLPPTLGGGKVSRSVRVIVTNQPLFTKEVMTQDGIDFNNNPVDCGCNDDPASGGLLSLNLDALLAIPHLQVIEICLQASVLNGTNIATVDAGVIAQGLINANVSADLNVYFTPAEPPSTPGSLPDINYPYSGTTYVYRASGNVAMDSLYLSGNQRLLVQGNTTLYVRGDMTLRDNSSIYITPGSKLKLIVGGSQTTIRDQAGITASDPLDLLYLGLNANTSININGAANLRGLIYAPNAHVNLGTTVRTGGLLGLGLLASLNLNFNGAVISRTLDFTTKTTYRFPTNVITAGPKRGFIVRSWEEI